MGDNGLGALFWLSVWRELGSPGVSELFMCGSLSIPLSASLFLSLSPPPLSFKSCLLTWLSRTGVTLLSGGFEKWEKLKFVIRYQRPHAHRGYMGTCPIKFVLFK